MSGRPFTRAAGLLPMLLAGAALLAGAPGGVDHAAPAPSGPDDGNRLDRDTRQDTTVVTMTNSLDFEPAEVTIRPGETVVWKNTTVLVHTVTAIPDSAANPEHVHLPDGADPFASGRLDPGATFQHTFTASGTYDYFCIPHEAAGMLGTVVVKNPTDGEGEETTQ